MRSAPDEEAYRFIGNVLALRSRPKISAALVHPSKLITVSFDVDVRRRLADGGALFAAQEHGTVALGRRLRRIFPARDTLFLKIKLALETAA